MLVPWNKKAKRIQQQKRGVKFPKAFDGQEGLRGLCRFSTAALLYSGMGLLQLDAKLLGDSPAVKVRASGGDTILDSELSLDLRFVAAEWEVDAAEGFEGNLQWEADGQGTIFSFLHANILPVAPRETPVSRGFFVQKLIQRLDPETQQCSGEIAVKPRRRGEWKELFPSLYANSPMCCKWEHQTLSRGALVCRPTHHGSFFRRLRLCDSASDFCGWRQFHESWGLATFWLGSVGWQRWGFGLRPRSKQERQVKTRGNGSEWHPSIKEGRENSLCSEFGSKRPISYLAMSSMVVVPPRNENGF